MKIRAMVASAKIDGTGERFSEEALNRMEETGIGASIRLTWHHTDVGNITKCWREGEPLFVEAEIKVSDELWSRGIAEKLEENDKLCLVPMITYEDMDRHLEGDVMVIDRAEVVGFAITTKPADGTLTPIEVIEE